MGYRVDCPGVELLNRLRVDPDGFLGEPFSLYIIALATQIDDRALGWLRKYEMQLDSLCGPYAAFFLFYNHAQFEVETGPWNVWGKSGTLFSDKFKYTDVDVTMDDQSIPDGMVRTDGVRRFDRKTRIEKQIYVTSMTYESDSIARELEIIDELPCLLVFDDLSSDTFYTLSLINPDEDTLTDLRTLLSKFVADSSNADYLSALRDWHSEQSTLNQLFAQRRDLLVKHPLNPNYIYTELLKSRELLIAGRAKKFRSAINLMASEIGTIDRVPWDEIRKNSNKVRTALNLSKKLQIADTMTEHRAAELERAGRLTSLPENANTETQSRVLREIAIHTADDTIDLILRSLGLSRLDGLLVESVQLVEEKINAQKDLIKQLSEALDSKQRPSLCKHVLALQEERPGKIFIQKTKGAREMATGRIPSIIDAIRKGLELLSNK